MYAISHFAEGMIADDEGNWDGYNTGGPRRRRGRGLEDLPVNTVSATLSSSTHVSEVTKKVGYIMGGWGCS